MKPSLNILVSLTIFLHVACGDDEDGGVYRSGVEDEDATVSTLDEADKQQICTSLDAHLNVTISFDEVARLACLPSAILLGGSREGCLAQLDACVQNAPPPLRIRAQATNPEVCYDSLAECNASVADIEACVNVSLDAAIDFLERVSCAGFADEDVRSTAQRMQTAQGCADVSATCDDFGPLLQ